LTSAVNSALSGDGVTTGVEIEGEGSSVGAEATGRRIGPPGSIFLLSSGRAVYTFNPIAMQGLRSISVALGIFLSSCDGSKAPLTMLEETDYPLAKCMDGTQAGYYAQTATNPNDNQKWVS
jgi:hypothetical protein